MTIAQRTFSIMKEIIGFHYIGRANLCPSLGFDYDKLCEFEKDMVDLLEIMVIISVRPLKKFRIIMLVSILLNISLF